MQVLKEQDNRTADNQLEEATMVADGDLTLQMTGGGPKVLGKVMHAKGQTILNSGQPYPAPGEGDHLLRRKATLSQPQLARGWSALVIQAIGQVIGTAEILADRLNIQRKPPSPL